MSTTFSPCKYNAEENRYTHIWTCTCTEDICANCLDNMVNVGQGNDMELLRWLGIQPEYSGSIKATELAAKCRRRLWDVDRNHDPAMPPEDSGGPGTGHARGVFFGREPGYLRARTRELLKLAERAGEHFVSWG